ncbi:MAG: outer-membrane lipoprotein carrier protein LolA [Candidatus Cloacimonadota bacterium]|nr:outer-membrane lipoprotein carrier protein LolA [Candidatus Cloacimonadota bacterium]
MATYLNKILLFLLLPILLTANEKALEKIYEQVLITYSTIATYETSFVQDNYWEEIDVYKNSEGKLYYDKENLLMDYSEPIGQKLLINKNNMTMYDPVSGQAIISDKIEIELRPDKLISHYWDMSEKELIDQFNSTIKIKLLTPEEEKIIITISNNIVTEFNIIDKNNNFVIYKFSDIEINRALPDKIFKLILPEGTNIIDTRSNK